MLGNQKIIDQLNILLSMESDAKDTYFFSAHIFQVLGFQGLYKYFEELYNDESEHAKKLTDRIIFYMGIPDFNTQRNTNSSMDIRSQVNFNLNKEHEAITKYSEVIALCEKEKDYLTRNFLTPILVEEETHIYELEQVIHNIEMMGINNFLSLMK
jgi:bacterioferritin